MTTTSAAPLRDAASSPSLRGAPLPPPVDLTPEAGLTLLRLARAVVAATASGRLRTEDLWHLLPRDPSAELRAPAAAFVTLHSTAGLRGCVGTLARDQPLWETVVSAAIGAASQDLRFDPVTEDEVPSLSIDVSVLGRPVPLRDPAAFRPGVDGLIVERRHRRGLLLPEVATDQGWGGREMLEATCRKASLPSDAWRDPRTSVLVFRTARVSDTDAER